MVGGVGAVSGLSVWLVACALVQLIIFIKNALNTRDPDVVRVTLKILQV